MQLTEAGASQTCERDPDLGKRMFDAADVFRSLGAARAVSGAQKLLALTRGYETPTRADSSWTSKARSGMRSRSTSPRPLRQKRRPRLRDSRGAGLLGPARGCNATPWAKTRGLTRRLLFQALAPMPTRTQQPLVRTPPLHRSMCDGRANITTFSTPSILSSPALNV